MVLAQPAADPLSGLIESGPLVHDLVGIATGKSTARAPCLSATDACSDPTYLSASRASAARAGSRSGES